MVVQTKSVSQVGKLFTQELFVHENLTLLSRGFGRMSEIWLLTQEDLCLGYGLYVYVHILVYYYEIKC